MLYIVPKVTGAGTNFDTLKTHIDQLKELLPKTEI